MVIVSVVSATRRTNLRRTAFQRSRVIRCCPVVVSVSE
jgi:hypothetical protein